MQEPDLLKEKLRQAAQHYLERDYARALPLIEWCVEAQSAAAAFMLGRMYEKGRGVPLDEQRAVALYLDAALGGVSHANVNLGWMLLEGRGCRRDREAAIDAWSEAAIKGQRAGAAEALAWLAVQERRYSDAAAWSAVGISLGSDLCHDYARLLRLAHVDVPVVTSPRGDSRS